MDDDNRSSLTRLGFNLGIQLSTLRTTLALTLTVNTGLTLKGPITYVQRAITIAN